MDYLPRYHSPASDQSANHNASSDIDVFGEETCKIVREGDDIGGEIGTDLSYNPSEAAVLCEYLSWVEFNVLIMC